VKWRIILPVSSKSRTRFHLAIVIVWLSFTVAAFTYFISDRLVKFDFENKLENINHQQLARSLKPYVKVFQKNKKIGNTVVHFSKSNCKCQKYSEQHIQDINKIAIENEFNIINVVVGNGKYNIIPATPSVAIMTTMGEIIYFGPYGQGLACAQTLGYAQTVLNNFIQGYNANIIIKDAKGCYCRV
jgi:hypothetical protein